MRSKVLSCEHVARVTDFGEVQYVELPKAHLAKDISEAPTTLATQRIERRDSTFLVTSER